MHEAITYADHARIENLVTKTAYVDINDVTDGKTYIQEAVYLFQLFAKPEHAETTELLIKLGADVNLQGKLDFPAWFRLEDIGNKHYALIQWHKDLLVSMLDAGLSPDAEFTVKGGSTNGKHICILGFAKQLVNRKTPEGPFGQWLVTELQSRGATKDCHA